MEVGIKESKELLAAVELVAVTGVEILKNGLGPEDVKPGLELLGKVNVLADGVKGLGELDEELKDLNEQELVELGLAAYGLIKKVVAASKKEVVA